MEAECGPEEQACSEGGNGGGEWEGQEGSCSVDGNELEDLLEGSGEGEGEEGSYEEGEDSCDWEDSSSCPPLGTGTPPRGSALHTPRSSASKRGRRDDDNGGAWGEQQGASSSPRADLAQQQGLGGEPATRTTPKTSVPSLSLGVLRKSIRMVSV